MEKDPIISLEKKLEPKHCALMVIDIQNDVAHQDGAFAKAGFDVRYVDDLIPTIQQLIDAAHRAGVMVIFVRNWKTLLHKSKPVLDRDARLEEAIGPYTVADTWGGDWYGVAPSTNDIVINKRRYDAFVGTDLDQILRSQGIRCLVFTGIHSNVCVESTARSAYSRDYFVVIVRDAVGTKDKGVHRAFLKNMGLYCGEVVHAKNVIKTWGGKTP